MERASRLLGSLKFPADTLSVEQLACAAWKSAVGKRIARHARAERLVRTRLIVGVDDAVWQRQLNTLSRIILNKLQATLGCVVVEDLEFRVAPPRRGPQRAKQLDSDRPAAPLFRDEADAIADPGLRRIYRAARSRALA